MTTPLIHTVTRFDRERIYRHFTRLSVDDRYRRFGFCRDDALLREYVEGIDFDRDMVLAVIGPDFEFTAIAHVGLKGDTAELGLSVLPEHRRNQLGFLLLQHAATRAQARGFRQLWICCLSENRAIRALASKAGMRIVSNGSDCDARMALPALSPIDYGVDVYKREFALWTRACQHLYATRWHPLNALMGVASASDIHHPS
jgi:GNAT superfamily N-acetyltransferase